MIWLIALIIDGLIWGAVCMLIVRNKGYENDQTWFLWGFLFSIFAVLVAISKPEYKKEMQFKTSEGLKYVPENSNGSWKCKCGALNHSSEEECHRCGRDKIGAAVLAPAMNTWVCSCGTRNRQSENKCRSCARPSPIAASAGPKTAAASPQPAPVQEQAANAADELKKYKELLDMGAITEEEYAAKKKQLLGL